MPKEYGTISLYIKKLLCITSLIFSALTSSVQAATWIETFDSIDRWVGEPQLLDSGILTLTSSNGDSLVTDFEAVPSRPTSIKFRAKPAEGTPGYASLQIHFYTSDTGNLNSESLALVLGGSESVGYKIVQAGYKGLFYAGKNQGLFTNDQQWHEFELKISRDQIRVFRNEELIDEIAVDGCSHLQWRGDRVVFHRDYYDLGQLLYDNIPLLGRVTGWLKRRLAP